jgi:predicted anti-sigma-YlaC factor YlaD
MIFTRCRYGYACRRIIVRERTMQAAYALTRLILFGFGWSIAAGLALVADELLPGVKWPVLAILAALWTFICALYVAGEANRNSGKNSTPPLSEEEVSA